MLNVSIIKRKVLEQRQNEFSGTIIFIIPSILIFGIMKYFNFDMLTSSGSGVFSSIVIDYLFLLQEVKGLSNETYL